jgi:hypothetical protein
VKFTKVEMTKSEGGSGGIFFKPDDGETVVLIPRGATYMFYSEYDSKKASDKWFAGASKRYRINVVLKENDRLVAKIWEFGVLVNNTWAELQEDTEKKDIEGIAFKVTRRGLGKDTTYVIRELKEKEQPSPEKLKEIMAVPLHVLEHKDVAAPPPQVKNHAPSSGDNEEKVPWD